MIKRFLLSLTFVCVFVTALAAQDPDSPIKVTFLHVNDVYQFAPVDNGARGGLARLLTLKKRITKENPNTLFTLGGDTLSPSVESITYKGSQMVEAWNAVGLDYSVFGNHEFDLKTPDILKRIAESKFTWLGANVIDTKTGKIFADTPEFVVREIGGVRIGLFGLLLPETKQTSSMDENLIIKDYCLTANQIVSRLRLVEKVDAVVALTHLSLEQDKDLAGCAPVDLILGGHEHTLLTSAANGTPIFKMTANARELGRFDLNFDRITKRLISIDWQVIPVDESVEFAPEFAAVEDNYRELLQELAKVVGKTSVSLDALSSPNRQGETNVGNLVADAYREGTGADVALVNGGSIRADMTYEPGVLTKRDILSISPFGNPIIKIEITGKTLRAAIEHGLGFFGESKEEGRFPHVSGMRYVFDVAKPSGARLVDISVGGKKLVDDAVYSVALSSFLVDRGGDGYTMLMNPKILLDKQSALKDSELLEKFIQASPDQTISPRIEGRIKRLN